MGVAFAVSFGLMSGSVRSALGRFFWSRFSSRRRGSNIIFKRRFRDSFWTGLGAFKVSRKVARRHAES